MRVHKILTRQNALTVGKRWALLSFSVRYLSSSCGLPRKYPKTLQCSWLSELFCYVWNYYIPWLFPIGNILIPLLSPTRVMSVEIVQNLSTLRPSASLTGMRPSCSEYSWISFHLGIEFQRYCFSGEKETGLFVTRLSNREDCQGLYGEVRIAVSLPLHH